MSNIDTGINDPEAKIEDNPLFAEFLQRERIAQEAAGETPLTETPAQSSQGEPSPEGTPEVPPSEPAGTEAPTEGEPVAPGTPSTEPPAPAPAAPVEGEPPAPAEAVEPEPTPPTEPSPAPEPPPSWAYGGVNYDESGVARMVALDNWARSLTQEQRTAVDLLLTGQYRLEAATAPQAPQPQPTPQPAPAPAPDLDDELLDPAVKARFDALNAEVSTLRQSAQSQEQQAFASQQHQIVTGLDAGRQAFQALHELTEPETMQLVSDVVGMQVLPSYLQAHNGDPTAAMQAALEARYWAQPQYQQREFERRAQAQVSTEQAEVRTRKVSAITGSGGSTAPRTDVPPADPRQARRQGLIKAVSEAMNGESAN